jgi:Domain of unknown function (DUF6532)
MYGRNAIMNSIITKARTKVEGHYQLSGDSQKIKDDVEWLLKDAAFMYGNIKLQVDTSIIFYYLLTEKQQERYFDSNKPFGFELIFTIIKSQWFPSSSRSKSDSTTTAALIKDTTLLVSLIILVTTVVHFLYI